MTPPSEVVMVNHRHQQFRAHPCHRIDARSNEREYQFNPAKDAFTYRVQIPGILISMITQDIPQRELRKFINTGKPIRIKPHGAN